MPSRVYSGSLFGRLSSGWTFAARLRIGYETDISAKQEQAKTDSRVSLANEHTRWPKDHQAKKGKGPKKTYGLTPPQPPGHATPATIPLQAAAGREGDPGRGYHGDRDGLFMQNILPFI